MADLEKGVKEVRWTMHQLLNMGTNEFRMFVACVNAHAFRMLGIPWTKRIEWFRDVATDDFVVRYE